MRSPNNKHRSGTVTCGCICNSVSFFFLRWFT